MRKIVGWVCYVTGACITVLSLQILINCELLGVFKQSINLNMTFWQYVLQSSGQHLSYPNGYFVHLVRDLTLLGIGILVIIVGRENFVFKEFSIPKNVTMVSCPECHRKTYADAYCRFCGFNLVTLQPSRENAVPMPFWKVSLYSYVVISALLVVMNLLLIKA